MSERSTIIFPIYDHFIDDINDALPPKITGRVNINNLSYLPQCLKPKLNTATDILCSLNLPELIDVCYATIKYLQIAEKGNRFCDWNFEHQDLFLIASEFALADA